ncbi:hypothetical protein [Megasphaera stantonii]|uniref:DUF3298/DUF4163 domain-containing protein n=1 Tax=Megasphaera stantonii TaxID=2144175 RepID=A0A346AZF6_9FIRM|nr:hypothetical protein [Megasphaera stantonii]AXL21249.1 hypothetical protein DKB62_06580 [Megasphaera stantonii]
MIEKVALILGFILSINSCIFANVQTGTFSAQNLNLVYPLVYVENHEAQSKINKDLAKIIYDIKSKYDTGKYYLAQMHYEVTYEDKDLVSILIKTHIVWNRGAAHGSVGDIGRVYNKNSGERIPLYNFVKIRDAKQIQSNLIDGVLSAYDCDFKNNVYYFRQKEWEVDTVSTNYILMGNGELSIIYPTYSIGPFSAGPIKVKFDKNAIDYFNRLNSQL